MMSFVLWRFHRQSRYLNVPKYGSREKVKKGLIQAETVVDTQAYHVPRRSVVSATGSEV
jgi:hypothetical protein